MSVNIFCLVFRVNNLLACYKDCSSQRAYNLLLQHIITNFIEPAPNISIVNMKEVSGQLVTPQNTLTIPHASHKPIGSPNTGAKKLPRVAPTKSVGTISPPLNPPPNVMAVNSIFKIKTYHEQLVIKLAAIIGAPAPR